MTNKKDFTKEALKGMGETTMVGLIIIAISSFIIGLPVIIAAVLGWDCQYAFAIGFGTYFVLVFLLLWFVGEYNAAEKKYYECRLEQDSNKEV